MDNQSIVHLLDDDESVVVALRRMLQSEGYAIRTWTSAVEFLNGHDPYGPGCVGDRRIDAGHERFSSCRTHSQSVAPNAPSSLSPGKETFLCRCRPCVPAL